MPRKKQNYENPRNDGDEIDISDVDFSDPAEAGRQLVGKLNQKAEDVIWRNAAPGVERRGNKIVLPNSPQPMSYRAARKVLTQIEEDENEVFVVSETIDAFPPDGATAFWKAICRTYGFASPKPTPGFFGPQPPQMLTIKTGWRDEDSIQVPYGRMQIPNIEGEIHTGLDRGSDGLVRFRVMGELKRKDSHLLKDLVNTARKIVREESIYAGKAFELPVDDDGDIEPMTSPNFICTDVVDPAELILNQDIAEQVTVNLLTPIQHTQECIDDGIPIKRGVLMEGPYGVGKTMTGRLAARVCEENGWTYILLSDTRALRQTLQIANRYAPCVVFAEDIDRILSDNDGAHRLINDIDSVVSKDAKVMVCLTTNHASKIAQIMLRPGRLDAVISFSPPDAESVQKLIKLYARNRLAEGVSLEEIGELLAGEIPATIREVVERAKLGRIHRQAEYIIESDLLTAAMGMAKHLNLLNREVDEKKTPAQEMAEAIQKMVAPGVDESGEIKHIHRQVDRIYSEVS